MFDIPVDLIPYITKYLSYRKCADLRLVYKGLTPQWLLANCELCRDNAPVAKALLLHNITPDSLYDVLKSSSLNPTYVYVMLDEMHYGTADIDNLMLTYNAKFVTPKNINATIQTVQILLTATQHLEGYGIFLNNVLMNYMIDVVMNKYYGIQPFHKLRNIFSIDAAAVSFRLKMYSTIWYRSNINIYLIFCLYLLNLGILHIKFTELILQTISLTTSNISANNDKVLTYIFDYLRLFSVNEGLALILFNLMTYLTTAGIYICKPAHKNIIQYLYGMIQNPDFKISEEMKNKLDHLLSVCLETTIP